MDVIIGIPWWKKKEKKEKIKVTKKGKNEEEFKRLKQ